MKGQGDRKRGGEKDGREWEKSRASGLISQKPSNLKLQL